MKMRKDSGRRARRSSLHACNLLRDDQAAVRAAHVCIKTKQNQTGGKLMAYQTLFQLRDRKIVRASLLLSTASLLSACWAQAALAQAQSEQPPAVPPAAQAPAVASHDEGEIIVTARKRQESILKVPVIMTAVSGETLENFQVTS